MFVDAVLPNLLVFALGQVAAWLYLRSGRFWVGTASTTAIWVLLDWWLVARYLFGAPTEAQRLPLGLLQLVALWTVAVFTWAKVRSRLERPLRPQRFRAGMQQLLANDLAAATASFQRLVKCDPWDTAAWIALGDALRRSGDARRARWCYRRAGGVDVAKDYADLLVHRARLADGGTAARQQAKVRLEARASTKQAEPAAVTTPIGD